MRIIYSLLSTVVLLVGGVALLPQQQIKLRKVSSPGVNLTTARSEPRGPEVRLSESYGKLPLSLQANRGWRVH